MRRPGGDPPQVVTWEEDEVTLDAIDPDPSLGRAGDNRDGGTPPSRHGSYRHAWLPAPETAPAAPAEAQRTRTVRRTRITSSPGCLRPTTSTVAEPRSVKRTVALCSYVRSSMVQAPFGG